MNEDDFNKKLDIFSPKKSKILVEVESKQKNKDTSKQEDIQRLIFWIKEKSESPLLEDTYKCSNCGTYKIPYRKLEEIHYCYNCGGKYV